MEERTVSWNSFTEENLHRIHFQASCFGHFLMYLRKNVRFRGFTVKPDSSKAIYVYILNFNIPKQSYHSQSKKECPLNPRNVSWIMLPSTFLPCATTDLRTKYYQHLYFLLCDLMNIFLVKEQLTRTEQFSF